MTDDEIRAAIVRHVKDGFRDLKNSSIALGSVVDYDPDDGDRADQLLHGAEVVIVWPINPA